MQPNESIPMRNGRIITAAEVETHRLAPLFAPARLLSRERHESLHLHADVVAQTTEMLKRASAEADAILSEARDTASAETNRGYETGRKNAAAEFSEMLVLFTDQMTAYRDAAERDLQQLALRFARALVDAEMTLKPERIAYLVRSTLGAARFLDHAVVRLHPDDAAFVREQPAILSASVSGKTRLTIVDDPALNRRSVRVETARGDVATSIDDFFNRLTEALLSSEAFGIDSPLPTIAPPVASVPDHAPATWQEDAAAGWAGVPPQFPPPARGDL